MPPGNEEDNGAVPALGLKMDDEHGIYVKLRDFESHRDGLEEVSSSSGGFLGWWLKLGALVILLGVLGVVVKWIGPIFLDKVVVPIVNWELATFSTSTLAVAIFLSIASFPILLLPSSPSMWLAGMLFGYGYGILLILSAAAFGVSLPYLIGSLFYQKIYGQLEKYPKQASIVRSPGNGNWFHQFRAVALIRVSPFPYIIYNYCAVATNVKYGPYILGSLVGIMPDVLMSVYTGIMIRTLAKAGQHAISPPQIGFNILGFCTTAVATVALTVYANRQLTALQVEETSMESHWLSDSDQRS